MSKSCETLLKDTNKSSYLKVPKNTCTRASQVPLGSHNCRSSVDQSIQSSRRSSWYSGNLSDVLSRAFRPTPKNDVHMTEEVRDDPILQYFIQSEKKRKAANNRERHLAIVMCVLIGVFILCYLPFWFTYICLFFLPSCSLPSITIIMSVVQWLTLTNSLLNPIVYTYFNKEFRCHILNTLRCKRWDVCGLVVTWMLVNLDELGVS